MVDEDCEESSSPSSEGDPLTYRLPGFDIESSDTTSSEETSSEDSSWEGPFTPMNDPWFYARDLPVVCVSYNDAEEY